MGNGRILGGIIFACVTATQAQEAPKFGIASIRRSAPDSRGSFSTPLPGGRVRMMNMSGLQLIQAAWSLPPEQISGGPSWLPSTRFDIVAQPDEMTSSTKMDPDLPLRLRALLADRFQLAFHRETREIAAYAIVLARKDGRLGPNLSPASEGGCLQPDVSKPPILQPKNPSEVPCGGMMGWHDNWIGAGMEIRGMTGMLASILGRPVVDRTGLTGRFDLHLQINADDVNTDLPPNVPKPSWAERRALAATRALEEQLGLKLESRKEPIETLLIDHVEMPSEN